MALRLHDDGDPRRAREVLEFDGGVRAYPPAGRGLWRIRWDEGGRRRETTARSRDEAIGRAGELVERLGRSAPTVPGRILGGERLTAGETT